MAHHAMVSAAALRNIHPPRSAKRARGRAAKLWSCNGLSLHQLNKMVADGGATSPPPDGRDIATWKEVIPKAGITPE